MSQSSPSRPALQPLPVNPTNQRIAPPAIPNPQSVMLRAKSRDNSASNSFEGEAEEGTTPPITPDSLQRTISTGVSSRTSSGFTDEDFIALSTIGSTFLPFANITAKPYLGTYLIDRNQSPLGRGAWSTVYRATETQSSDAAANQNSHTFLVLTPPNSPQRKGHPSNAVLAVKSPSRRDAPPILLHEARILTYLGRYAAASNHILAFRGWDAAKLSLVMAAYPQTLDQYVKGVGASLVGPTDPVIGRDLWMTLVRRLVSALLFLHNVNCVHGDIKPSNVLLSFGGSKSIHPVLADFSSSHVLPPNSDTSKVPEVNATTTDYTSPELLAAMLPKDPRRAVATFTNDVYGLGVTLLEAAAGEKPYASAKGMMKLIMAREGRVVDFMSGESRRIGRGVRDLVAGACIAKEENRWTAGKWAHVVEGGWRE